MKVAHHLFLIGAACVLAGCSRLESTPSLDEVINALPPDEWGSDIIVLGIATNNYTVLNRVVALTNVKERIRLAWKLYNHFRHSPEWYVEHREGGLWKSNRHEFFGNCAYRLMWSTNATPETIIEGWKMEAETIRDQVELIRLTGPEWQARMQKIYEEKEAARYAEFRRRLKAHGGGPSSYLFNKTAPEIGYAQDVRQRYDNYFRRDFSVNSSYRKLPDEMKPEFIEQLKRDFFIYSDVTNAYMWKYFQPELKEAFMEVRKQMESK